MRMGARPAARAGGNSSPGRAIPAGMTDRRPLLILVAAAVASAGWYLFRPELLLIDRVAQEAAPITPTRVAQGAFHGDAHETSGTATILQLPDGRTVLRFTSFATSNGPDVRVYLVAADSVADEGTVKRAGFIDLGALKGNLGDQNYELPAGTDLTRYRAVSIWCRRFAVNFGAAALRG